MAKDLTLFNIQNGNVCALCEHQLNWYPNAKDQEKPVALTIRRAICTSCFKKLCQKLLVK